MKTRVVIVNDGRVFKSIKEVSEELGISASSISNCINGKRGCMRGKNKDDSHIKYVFMREEEYNKLTEEEIKDVLFNKQSLNGRDVVLLNTGEYFNSITNASKAKGVSYASIYHCINGETHRAKSPSGEYFVWMDKHVYESLTVKEIKNILNDAKKEIK